MTETSPIPGLDTALAARASVVARQATIQHGIRDAQERQKEALAKRADIIARLSAGETPASAEIPDAEDAIRLASANLAALEEAFDASGAVVVSADRRIALARLNAARRSFISAAKNHMAVLEEGDEIGRMITAWLARLLESEAAMHNAMHQSGRHSQEELSMLGNRHDWIAVIPRQIQAAIIQTGSAINYGLADRRRAVWGRAILDAKSKIGDDA